MSTSSIRISLGVILGVILLSSAYFVGYARCRRVESHAHDVLSLKENLGLYRLLEHGDTNGLSEKLRFFVSLDIDYYDKHCSGEWATVLKAQDLRDARAIASGGHTLVDENNQTNK